MMMMMMTVVFESAFLLCARLGEAGGHKNLLCKEMQMFYGVR